MGYKCLLETNRLILRQCTPDDLAIFEEIFGDGEMMRHFGECKPLAAAEARAWLGAFAPPPNGLWQSAHSASIMLIS